MKKSRNGLSVGLNGGKCVASKGKSVLVIPILLHGSHSVSNSVSLDAEWITAKKDWEQAKRRHKAHEREKSGHSHKKGQHARATTDGSDQEIPAVYEPEMDKMRCILFAHGGRIGPLSTSKCDEE